MKLVHPELSRAIIDDTVDYTEWIIEAAESFATFVYELIGPMVTKISLRAAGEIPSAQKKTAANAK